MNSRLHGMVICGLTLCGVMGCVHHRGTPVTILPSLGATVDPESQPLHRLEPFVRRALDEDLTLKSLRMKVDRVRREYTLVPDTRDPEIRWSYRRQVEDPNEYDVTVGLRIYPEAPWDWSARRKQYRLMRQIADMEEQAWEYMTAYGIRRQIEALQVMREEVRYLALAKRLAEKLRNYTEAQHEAGQVAWEDAIRTRLDLVDADTAYREKQAAYQAALGGVAGRLQWEPQEVEVRLPSLSPPMGIEAPLEVEILVDQALDLRMEPGALEMQWRLMRYEKALDIPLWLPWTRHLQGGYRLAEDDFSDLWMISGAVTLPLSGLTQSRTGQLKQMDRERKLQVEALLRGITDQVREMALYYEQAREQWIQFQQHTQPVMRSLMKDLSELHDAGQVSHSSIARQQQALVEAFTSRATLMRNLLTAQTNLEEACGIVSW